MKKLLAALCLTPIISYAEIIPLPVTCGTADEYKAILKQSGEEISWIGEGKNQENGTIYNIITINKETMSWTNAVLNADQGRVCILGFGHTFGFAEEESI